jgi:hypothetical protein
MKEQLVNANFKGPNKEDTKTKKSLTLYLNNKKMGSLILTADNMYEDLEVASPCKIPKQVRRIITFMQLSHTEQHLHRCFPWTAHTCDI